MDTLILPRPVRTPKPITFHDHDTDVLYRVMRIVPQVRKAHDTWLAWGAEQDALDHGNQDALDLQTAGGDHV